VKLVKFLEGGETIEHMTTEEADYYFGVLNKKVHKSMRIPKNHEPVVFEERVPQIFQVTKVERKDFSKLQKEEERRN